MNVSWERCALGESGAYELRGAEGCAHWANMRHWHERVRGMRALHVRWTNMGHVGRGLRGMRALDARWTKMGHVARELSERGMRAGVDEYGTFGTHEK